MKSGSSPRLWSGSGSCSTNSICFTLPDRRGARMEYITGEVEAVRLIHDENSEANSTSPSSISISIKPYADTQSTATADVDYVFCVLQLSWTPDAYVSFVCKVREFFLAEFATLHPTSCAPLPTLHVRIQNRTTHTNHRTSRGSKTMQRTSSTAQSPQNSSRCEESPAYSVT